MAAWERGTDNQRPSKGTMSPREAWEEIRELSNIRAQLVSRGWLPPRDKDVRARRGAEDGPLLARNPTKWSSERKYSRDELPIAAQDYYLD